MENQLKKEAESVAYKESEKDLNSNILKITMRIKDQFPALSKYIEEIPVTIPDEKHPEISLKNLKIYYESLNSMLNKYLLEHTGKAKLKKCPYSFCSNLVVAKKVAIDEKTMAYKQYQFSLKRNNISIIHE
jgi:hypothetical protein